MSIISMMNNFTVEKIDQYNEFCNLLDQHLARVCPPETAFLKKCAVLEGLNNAIEHGEFPVYINFKEESNDRFLIKITDSGQGFTVNDTIQLIENKGPDQILEERLRDKRGRGICIMYKTVSRVQFNEKGNEVTLFI